MQGKWTHPYPPPSSSCLGCLGSHCVPSCLGMPSVVAGHSLVPLCTRWHAHPHNPCTCERGLGKGSHTHARKRHIFGNVGRSGFINLQQRPTVLTESEDCSDHTGRQSPISLLSSLWLLSPPTELNLALVCPLPPPSEHQTLSLGSYGSKNPLPSLICVARLGASFTDDAIFVP